MSRGWRNRHLSAPSQITRAPVLGARFQKQIQTKQDDLKWARPQVALMGAVVLIFCFGLSGCGNETDGASDKEAKSTENVKSDKYNRAEVNAEPGNPGKTNVTLTGPGGATTTMIATGYAEDVEVGDLDNDGQSGDVALVMRTGSNVTVIRLVGDSLQAPVSYPTGTNPQAVAVGDVNGDRVVDLVTANGAMFQAGTPVPGSLSVLLGNGDGTFGAASALEVGTISERIDVGLGDFNGDGKVDIATAVGWNLNGADATTRSLTVRLGLGGGGFGPEQPVATAQGAVSLEVLDFNGDVDGHDDIVTNGSVLLGRGDGTFAAPVNVAPGLNPILVKVEDLNQDERPDLVLLSTVRPNLATILLGHGDGTVASPQHYTLNVSARTVAFYEVDGDSIGDLLFSGDSQATLLPGRGDGTFHGVQAVPSVPNLSGYSGSSGAAVADFTGDGIPDVAVANGGFIQNGFPAGNPAAILPGLGAGKFGNPVVIPGQIGSSVVSGDWNGDTRPDLAFVGKGANSPLLLITPGLGGGGFGPYASTVLPGTADVPLPTLLASSLNHDDAPDLLVGNFAGNEVSVFLGDGIGGFTGQSPVSIGNPPTLAYGSPPNLAVGDFNADTHPDLVVAEPGTFDKLEGTLKLAFGNGNGSFQAPRLLREAIAAYGVAATDFNRDGKLDLALALETRRFFWDVEIFLGLGDGSFAPPKPLGLTQTLVSGLSVVDADKDGKQDLLVRHGGGTLGLRGLGDGRFSPVMTGPIGFTGTVLTADLNQDGWPDLLAANRGYVDLYLNELPTLFAQYPPLEIVRAIDTLTLHWPDFFSDFILSETPALNQAFVPSQRAVRTEGGFFNVDLSADEAGAGFFRLEPRN